MNIDTFSFKKKDFVKSKEAFNELEKGILNHKPTKMFLDQSIMKK